MKESFSKLEFFLKENNFPKSQRKKILEIFEQVSQVPLERTLKNSILELLYFKFFLNIKKNCSIETVKETCDKLIKTLCPDWNLEQLDYEISICEIKKEIFIIEKNNLTKSLFETILILKQ